MISFNYLLTECEINAALPKSKQTHSNVLSALRLKNKQTENWQISEIFVENFMIKWFISYLKKTIQND